MRYFPQLFGQVKPVLASVCAIAALASPWGFVYSLHQQFQSFWPVQIRAASGRGILPDQIVVGSVRDAASAEPGLFAGMPGLEKTLLSRLEALSGRRVGTIEFDSSAALRKALDRGEVHVATSGFLSDKTDQISVISIKNHSSSWIIAYSPGIEQPRSDTDLRGKMVTVLPRLASARHFRDIQARFPETQFRTATEESEESLLADLDTGRVGLALIDEPAIDALQHVYIGVGKGLPVHSTHRAWLVRAGDGALSAELSRFAQQIDFEGTTRTLREHYDGHSVSVNSFDAMIFQDQVADTLPKWKRDLTQAQENTGLDWRLLASLAYQESRWHASAVSPTGVRGFMQLTQETADMYRVDRRNPNSAIAAGAKHLVYLHRATPERIAEPDRTFFALAAYNVGLGHVEDARVLTQRAGKNPDVWVDVKTFLPLLSKPAVATSVKHGHARGHEAVEYVDRIRAFYDIIARLEDPHRAPAPPPMSPELRTALLANKPTAHCANGKC